MIASSIYSPGAPVSRSQHFMIWPLSLLLCLSRGVKDVPGKEGGSEYQKRISDGFIFSFVPICGLICVILFLL